MDNVYKVNDIGELLRSNAYAGRGIVTGCSGNGKYAIGAYFIMGRSENSRNRVFAVHDGDVFTEPYDPAKVEDPSLIIYAAVRHMGDKIVITNGDQTDTIRDSLRTGGTFDSALESREFEPDAPNFTPRISAMMTFDRDSFKYEMSILKSADLEGSACSRYFYRYPSLPGVGHFIHTYMHDGNPLPTFCGEPERVAVPDDIDEMTDIIWNSLNADNRISLYVCYRELESGNIETRVINKNSND